MDKFSIWLLGLESHIFSEIESSEKAKFNRITKNFLVIVITFILGSLNLFFLLTNNFFASVILAICFGMIGFSMYRFSLITLRRSVYDDIHQMDLSTVNNLENEVKVKLDEKPAKKEIIPFLKSFFLRFLIFTPFNFLIVFGLTSLFIEDEINKICAQQHQLNTEVRIAQLKSDFDFKYKSNKSRILELELQQTRTKISAVDSSNNLKILENNTRFLYNQLFQDSMDFEIECGRILSNSREVPFLFLVVFDFSLKKIIYWVLFIVFLFLLIWVHFELHQLKVGKNFKYATLSTAEYRKMIEYQYETFKIHRQKLLDTYNRKKLIVNLSDNNWQDPPFYKKLIIKPNEVQKIPYVKLESILNANFKDEE